ncbi:MAG: hypothetical protein ABIH53_01910 [archaeon]
MEEITDRSDGRKTYYSTLLLDGFGLLAENGAGEFYLIQCFRPSKATKDSRFAILRVASHFPPFNGEKRRKLCHDKLEAVIDLKNHNPKMPFHLNLTSQSKEIILSCKKCKKYFDFLNHFEIVSDIGTRIKIINLNKTMESVIKKLEELGFFEEFKKVSKHRIG